MKSLATMIASGLMLATAGAAYASAVEVAFVAPEKYIDANRYNRVNAPRQEEILRELGRHLEGLGDRYLTHGEKLHIDVLDIDLAGEFDYAAGPASGVRIMRDNTVPRIRVHYELTQGTRVVVDGDEQVTDLGYLDTLGRRTNTDDLYYEKQMLTNWFVARFVDHKPPPA